MPGRILTSCSEMNCAHVMAGPFSISGPEVGETPFSDGRR